MGRIRKIAASHGAGKKPVMVLSGLAVPRIDLSETNAFALLTGVDLSPYAGVEGSSTPYMLILRDANGRQARGYIGAQDAAESLGAELGSNIDMETGDPPSDWNASSATLAADTSDPHGGLQCLEITALTGFGGTNQVVASTPGALYKTVGWGRVTAGDTIGFGLYDIPNSAWTVFTSTAGTSWTERSNYGTARAGATSHRITALGFTAGDVVYIDDFSNKRVMDVGATGVHIVDAKRGSTRAWFSIHDSFDYHASTYDYEVWTVP